MSVHNNDISLHIGKSNGLKTFFLYFDPHYSKDFYGENKKWLRYVYPEILRKTWQGGKVYPPPLGPIRSKVFVGSILVCLSVYFDVLVSILVFVCQLFFRVYNKFHPNTSKIFKEKCDTSRKVEKHISIKDPFLQLPIMQPKSVAK